MNYQRALPWLKKFPRYQALNLRFLPSRNFLPPEGLQALAYLLNRQLELEFVKMEDFRDSSFLFLP